MEQRYIYTQYHLSNGIEKIECDRSPKDSSILNFYGVLSAVPIAFLPLVVLPAARSSLMLVSTRILETMNDGSRARNALQFIRTLSLFLSFAPSSFSFRLSFCSGESFAP